MPPFLASFAAYLPLLIFIALWWLLVKRETALRPQPPKRLSRGEERAGGGATRLSLVEKWESAQTADENPLGNTARPGPVPSVVPDLQPTSAPPHGFPRPFATKIVHPGNLREAVVWSEILGPPAGLREE